MSEAVATQTAPSLTPSAPSPETVTSAPRPSLDSLANQIGGRAIEQIRNGTFGQTPPAETNQPPVARVEEPAFGQSDDDFAKAMQGAIEKTVPGDGNTEPAADAPAATEAEVAPTDGITLSNPLEELDTAPESDPNDIVSAAYRIAQIQDPALRALATEGLRARLLTQEPKGEVEDPRVEAQAQVQPPAATDAPSSEQEMENRRYQFFIQQYQKYPSSQFGNENRPTMEVLHAAFKGEPVLHEIPQNATPEQRQYIQRKNNLIKHTVREALRDTEAAMMRQELAELRAARQAPAQAPQAPKADPIAERSQMVVAALIDAVDNQLKIPHALSDDNPYRDNLTTDAIREFNTLASDPKYAALAKTKGGASKIMAGAVYNVLQRKPLFVGNGSAIQFAGKKAIPAQGAQKNVDGSPTPALDPAVAAKVSSPKTINPGGRDATRVSESGPKNIFDGLSPKEIQGESGRNRVLSILNNLNLK